MNVKRPSAIIQYGIYPAWATLLKEPTAKTAAAVIEKSNPRQDYPHKAPLAGDGHIAFAEQFVEVSISSPLKNVAVDWSEELASPLYQLFHSLNFIEQFGPMLE